MSSKRHLHKRGVLEVHRICLAVDDNRRMHETLLVPPEPNERLIAALRRYSTGNQLPATAPDSAAP